MNALLVDYALLVHGVRVAVFVAAVVVGVVALVDWLVRTRRISPFSAIARFFRRSVDPLMVPVERTVIRAGGQPAAAPWWTLVSVVVGGVLLIFLMEFVGGLLRQLAAGADAPRLLPVLLLSWVFKLLEFGLLVRVIVSWLPISRYSRWVRWSFTLTEWFLAPLRRIIPPLGMIDITPFVAYLALAWVLEPLLLGTLQRAVGT
ncbi:MAG TPA: YggT family protein [Gemmatimonadaceae bacterium]|jgi:YggT family protein